MFKFIGLKCVSMFAVLAFVDIWNQSAEKFVSFAGNKTKLDRIISFFFLFCWLSMMRAWDLRFTKKMKSFVWIMRDGKGQTKITTSLISSRFPSSDVSRNRMKKRKTCWERYHWPPHLSLPGSTQRSVDIQALLLINIISAESCSI